MKLVVTQYELRYLFSALNNHTGKPLTNISKQTNKQTNPKKFRLGLTEVNHTA